jgi:hypothetical protein
VILVDTNALGQLVVVVAHVELDNVDDEELEL